MRRGAIGSAIISIPLAVSILIGPRAGAQQAPQRLLLALSKADHTLALVNPGDLKVIARVPVGADPHEVIASADGKTAYVSNYGGGRFHELYVIDLIAQKALPTFDTLPLLGPHGLTFVGGKLWFTVEGSKCIARFDPATSKVEWIMGTGQNRTHMIYVTADEKEIYTTNVASGTVSILDNILVQPMLLPGANPHADAPSDANKPHMQWMQTLIPLDKGVEGFDVSPDGKELWTAAAETGTLSIIDIPSKKVTSTIDAKLFGANRLKFTPDGKRVLISSLRSNDLVVYDAASRQAVKRINIGHGAAGILIDDHSPRAFVACTPDNYVAVVDLNTLEVTGHADVGGKPDGLAWANPQ